MVNKNSYPKLLSIFFFTRPSVGEGEGNLFSSSSGVTLRPCCLPKKFLSKLFKNYIEVIYPWKNPFILLNNSFLK